MKRLIVRSFQCPGDTLMLTAAIRDLHAAHSGNLLTDVRTSTDAIWENNPYITPLNENDPQVQTLDMHYPLIHQSNQRPYHFLHGYVHYLEQELRLDIPVTRFQGDVHLSRREKQAPIPGAELGVTDPFWIIVAGGKYDFTAKWWEPARYQQVVDHFKGKILFVQCGEEGHWHPRLNGVVDLVGKTDLREFVRLMYHADGVLCPVTFAMHLAAAVETKPGKPLHRACVVVAGGREPPHWEAYPQHQFLSTVGALSCCAEGGCWKSRCQLVGDGDEKDSRNVCEQPVQLNSELRIPRCLDMITPDDVIRRIEMYYAGGLYHERNGHPPKPPTRKAMATINPQTETPATPVPNADSPAVKAAEQVLIRFRHGLGDAVQLTSVLQHLEHYHPEWEIDVGALPGKQSCFHGQAHRVFNLDRDNISPADYDRVLDLEWPECSTCYADSPSSKAERCLREVFHLKPIPELCHYTIQQSVGAVDLARRYLESICKVTPGLNGRYPVVLIHYEGNTSAGEKNLPAELIGRLCDDIIEWGLIPVILDWDSRSPLPDGHRIHNPHAHVELWGGSGTGDAEVLAALTELAALMVGVDSGPLHIAGATSTPTLAIWTGHHPLHYFGHADHVTHLIPNNHLSLLRGDPDVGGSYFEEHFRFQTYNDLEKTLRSAVKERLKSADGGLVHTRGFWIRSDNAAQDLVVVQDISEEDSYRVRDLPMPQPVIVDVGAHIGCFAKKYHERNPLAHIIAVECCPENIPALTRNAGGFAKIYQAAVTYEQNIGLLNAVFRDCVTTGGSTVISQTALQRRVEAGELETEPEVPESAQYWADFRPLKSITLEELLAAEGVDHIDVLKLDCEGSEFSILEETLLRDRIGIIIGEYHGKQRFLDLVRRRFADWELRILRDGELGTFWLVNPQKTQAERKPLKATSIDWSGTSATHPPEWLYLCTPMHSGTHFARLLLELHPEISFWKCGRTQIDGKSLDEWHDLYAKGRISYQELLDRGIRCEADLPAWSVRELKPYGIEFPAKQVRYHLVQQHCGGHRCYRHESQQTIATVRDPLLAVISGLRRSNPIVAQQIVEGFEFLLNQVPEASFLCVDLWKERRPKVLELFDRLELEPTSEILEFLVHWPHPNQTGHRPGLIENDSDELIAAREWVQTGRGIHPIVEPWVEKLRAAGLQRPLEQLGYRDLVWFR